MAEPVASAPEVPVVRKGGLAGREPVVPGAGVALAGVTAGYGGRIALEDVSLEIPGGTMVAVVGPNGSGKSTLLKLLLGLLVPWSGTIGVLGQAPSDARPR